MLKLKNITKDYIAGDTTVEALRGIDIEFRKNEFVSVLGPSGCGKTTLLNIIGGLDRYTQGDLKINNISTKDFSDNDWDTYRNHSVGFVFQTYNLISHQSVLANVELALTLSGVSREERKRRAIIALESVGLGDQIYKKPNQISGGQMQRVAIARALVNDPDILLADEPTGAIDSKTSLQIMNIIKEIAKDRLVIMVTHNPDLAKEYSTRIIELLDGKVTGDSNPYNTSVAQEDLIPEKRKRKSKKSKTGHKKPVMNFFTALSLSLNNLLTKKTRTILTSFAGSIGIIGIALIMSLSNGMQAFIAGIERDTLTGYPITIEETSVDYTSLMASMLEDSTDVSDQQEDKIYSNDIMVDMIDRMFAEISTNDLYSFKKFIESGDSDISSHVSDITYSYSVTMNIFQSDIDSGVSRVNPSTVFDSLPRGSAPGGPIMGNSDIWVQLIGDDDFISTQFDVLAGNLPENFNQVVLVVDENNQISDFTLFSLGFKDQSELSQIMADIREGKDVDSQKSVYDFDDILGTDFKLVLNTDFYEEQDGKWIDRSEDEDYMKSVLENSLDVEVVGILRPAQGNSSSSPIGAVGYTRQLTEYLIEEIKDSEIAKQQIDNPDIDVFSGLPFSGLDFEQPGLEFPQEGFDPGDFNIGENVTYERNLRILGVVDEQIPSSINIYPKDFNSKEEITAIIASYNQRMLDEGNEKQVIQYTDFIKLLLSSVSTIINAISYVLIGFVAISLVVSSIMIGIITYISVLERTKEIGILRSIGASKKDISRVFNAETIIIGFVAGILGIGLTLILTIPINIIINSLANVANAAILPVVGGIALIIISMALTFIAGLIPSKIAAKKDPVVALRTE